MRRIFFGFGLSLTLLGCGQYLQQFTDEDQEISIRIVSDTVPTTTYSMTARTLSFNLVFTADRAGSYRIDHADNCGGNHTAAGNATTGRQAKNSEISTAVTISLNDLSQYGNNVAICVQDSAGHKSATLLKNFSGGLTNMASQIASAGGGVNIDSGFSTQFQIFQQNWGDVGTNRNGGVPVLQNGVSNPYSHAVYLDPNDAYRLKYFVVDRANHRVLIFNQIPTSNAASPDVVVGQTNFTTGGAGGINAGLGAAANNQGFNQPVHASVSVSGVLFVTDYNNNRVVGFNQIPTTNGKTADFVLGQDSFTVNNANGAGSLNSRLNSPYATHAINDKLYIVDYGNDRIVVHNTIPSSNSDASFVIGKANFSGTGTTSPDYTVFTNKNFLSTPYDLLVDQGKLYISDSGHHRILIFDTLPTSSDQRPDRLIGHTAALPVMANQGGGVTANGLNYPTTLVVQNNKLAVADEANHRILFYDLPISATYNTPAQQVLGQGGSTNFTSGGSNTIQGGFNFVKGLIFDNGYIWAADGGNNRVQVLQLPY